MPIHHAILTATPIATALDGFCVPVFCHRYKAFSIVTTNRESEHPWFEPMFDMVT